MKTIVSLILGLFATAVCASAQGTFALVGGDIETVANGRITGGTVVIVDGLITAVGRDITPPEGAEVIDCSGLTIYPGFFDAGTTLGLIEIGAVEETRDESEMGDITPHARALTAVNPNSVSIPVTRVSGVTTALTAPRGGLLAGTASVISLFGYTPDQMAIEGGDALILNFPEKGRGGWWDERSDEEREKEWREKLTRLDEVWEGAEVYARIDSAGRAGGSSRRDLTYEHTAPYEAMLPAMRGDIPVVIEVNQAADIDSALAWIARHDIPRPILSGVREGWRVADHIAAAGIPCIVGPVLAIPTRASDRYDRAYANPGLLAAAGVRVALRTNDAENVRNLPFNAGFAVAHGMEPTAALRAITLTPAEIFGVDDQIGSIEVGRQGTLFAIEGDPFETDTSPRYLFIRGWNVPLESRHTQLYNEFLDRTP